MKKTFLLTLTILALTITLGMCSCTPTQTLLVSKTSEVLLPMETKTIAPPTAELTASSAPSMIPSLTRLDPSTTPAITPQDTLEVDVTEESDEQPVNTTIPSTQQKGAYCIGKKVDLKIPDRDEDENAPDEGWCGETSIQMALGYFGKNVSQYAIHLAGKPTHPELWEEDISPALDTLGMTYVNWDINNKDLNAFMTWIGDQLQIGHPILLGVKIYPDESGWDNDHFVLVVGCDSKGLIINTNNAGEGQVYVTYEELTINFEDSYSLVNNENNHYGWAILGLR